MTYFKYSFLTTALSLMAVSSVFADQNRWPVHADLSFKGGNKRSIGQASLFAPLYQKNDHMLFADLRFMGDTKKAREGNFGLGYRFMESDYILGVYGFYDRRKSSYDNYFNQVTLGAEYLTEDFDFRLNSYVPESKKKVAKEVRTKDGRLFLRGNQLVRLEEQVMRYYERPLYGFDIEIGRSVPYLEDLKLSAAYYQFWGKKVKSIYGARFKADYKLFENLTLQGELSYDRVRKTNYFLGANLRVPLGAEMPKPASRLALKMNQRVIRDIDVVTAAMPKATQHERVRDLGKAAVDPVDIQTSVEDGAERVLLTSNRTLTPLEAAALRVSKTKVTFGHFKDGVFVKSSGTLTAPQRVRVSSRAILNESGAANVPPPPPAPAFAPPPPPPPASGAPRIQQAPAVGANPIADLIRNAFVNGRRPNLNNAVQPAARPVPPANGRAIAGVSMADVLVARRHMHRGQAHNDGIEQQQARRRAQQEAANQARLDAAPLRQALHNNPQGRLRPVRRP